MFKGFDEKWVSQGVLLKYSNRDLKSDLAALLEKSLFEGCPKWENPEKMCVGMN